jgi:hypothetical protein
VRSTGSEYAAGHFSFFCWNLDDGNLASAVAVYALGVGVVEWILVRITYFVVISTSSYATQWGVMIRGAACHYNSGNPVMSWFCGRHY